MANLYKTPFFLLVMMIAFTAPAAGQVGVLDQSFGVGGKVITYMDSLDPVYAYGVALQVDGKIVVVGENKGWGYESIFVNRYDSLGRLDSSFAVNGKFILDFWVGADGATCVKVQPDGKILVGGYAHFPPTSGNVSDADFFVLRLNTNGTLDSSFGVNGVAGTDMYNTSADILYDLEILPNGKIIAGGFVQEWVTFKYGFGLVQYNTDGSIDSSFGVNGKMYTDLFGTPNSGKIKLQPDGKILAISTREDNVSQVQTAIIARYNANGTPDAGFGTAGIASVSLGTGNTFPYGIDLQQDGKIVVTGENDQNWNSSIILVRLMPNGILDAGFGNNGAVMTAVSQNSDAGTDIHVQPDGKIIVSGLENYSFDSSNFVLLRYNTDGSLDQGFGRHGIISTDFMGQSDDSYASVIQPDGKIILVGGAEDSSWMRYIAMARYERNALVRYNTLKGAAFLDANSNGLKDAGEEYISVKIIAAKAPADTIGFISSGAGFSGDIDTGSYTISVATHLPWYNIVPPSYTIVRNTYFNTDSAGFALQPIPGKTDIAVNLVPLTPARPGFNADYALIYMNNGTDTITTGHVDYVLNGNTVFNTATVTPVIINDTLRWNFSNLKPLDSAAVFINLTIKVPPIVNVGDTLVSTASIVPSADLNSHDNSSTLVQQVVGSYDPNDKAEAHGGKLTLAELQDGERLQYVIRFQNTGTDTAFNVYIRDTLSANLDWGSLQMIAASHNYQLTINDGRHLQWTFANINLVDSFTNEPGSNGYIIYSIKPKATLQLGDVVNNSAAIYFDYNLPVITNTTQTQVVTGVLPVTLLNFTARKTGDAVRLEWRTATETGLSHYQVERSIDGREYSGLGSVNAGGNEYSYTDQKPMQGVNYYRLKMVDKDGSTQYSGVRTIVFGAEWFLKLYPNPAGDLLNITASADSKKQVQLQVISMSGVVMLTAPVTLQQGSTNHILNIGHLPTGTYVLRMTDGEIAQNLLFRKE